MRFWIICGMMAVVLLFLLGKIWAMRRAAREIREELAEKTETETNTLLTTGSRDREMRRLADAINVQLRLLRSRRHRYEQGNQALQDAVTNISHDIRTPLTAISGYLELLEQEEKSETVGRYLEVVQRRVKELKELTEELFAYVLAVPADGGVRVKDMSDDPVFDTNSMTDVSDVNLNRALEESLSAHYGAFMTRQITPEISMPEEEIVRRLNPAAVSRIFANILNNAVKYSDGDLKIRLSQKGEIEFSNHAAALDEIQVGRMFERFYTVESGEHATGLGLSIARILTEQMGGGIRARQEEGVFTVCVVFFED